MLAEKYSPCLIRFELRLIVYMSLLSDSRAGFFLVTQLDAGGAGAATPALPAYSNPWTANKISNEIDEASEPVLTIDIVLDYVECKKVKPAKRPDANR